MKLNLRFIPLVSSMILAVGLAGCAATPAQSDAHVHADKSAKPGMGGMGGMGGSGGMGMMDMQQKCEMHKKMMAGKSPADQQAMMQERMKAMTPEMRQRMEAMHQQCR
ncbi:hypothetical protein [Caenimonas sp. SL110]|uniref:hypothetical protein n=1 Tax=Caenimonas sp. SL110 TaxID=1450524 RepID=UPI0006539FCD|nr:hypothetical protein [Caenimonas sp. SL110]